MLRGDERTVIGYHRFVKSVARVGVFLVAATWARIALPCDCVPPAPVERAFADARVVAVARVAKVAMTVIHEESSIRTGPVHIRLEITRAWKGAKAGDVIEVVRVEQSDCDYDLEEGTTHVLYLEPREQGRIDARASHCARSRAINAADEEILALDKLARPAPAMSPGPPPHLAPPRSGCAGCATGASSTSACESLAAAIAFATIAALRRRRSRS